MKKKLFVIVVLTAISLVLIRHAVAFWEFHKISVSLANLNECHISVLDYGSAHFFDVVDTTVAKEICQAATELQYNGIFRGRKVMTPADQAYSLIISSREFHVVLEIAGDPKQSRIVGNTFPISIKNYDDLYGLVEEICAATQRP